MAIDLNFFLQRDEYHSALNFFRAQQDSVAIDKVVGGILWIVGFAVWAITGNIAIGVVFFLVGLAVALLSAPLRTMMFRQKWEREPFYSAQQWFSFREEGIFFRWDTVESLLPWTYYKQMLESADGFLLLYGETFNYFPKRAFQGADQINAFRELINQKLAAKKP